MVQLSTLLQRGARPARISRSRLRRNNANRDSAAWEHLLLAGVLVGDVHSIFEVFKQFGVHNVLGGDEYQLEVELTVNCQRFDWRAVPRENESLETATGIGEGRAVIRGVNRRGRDRFKFVPGSCASIRIVAVNRFGARGVRALVFLGTLATFCGGHCFGFRVGISGGRPLGRRRFVAAAV